MPKVHTKVFQMVGKIEKLDFGELNELLQDLSGYFDTQHIEIWHYCEEVKSARLITDSAVEITIASGIVYHSLLSKEPTYSNHIVSDKRYEESEDNPFSYKAKSILVYPIVAKEEVVGFLKVYIEMGKGRHFAKHDFAYIGRYHDKIVSLIMQVDNVQFDKEKNGETKSACEVEEKAKKTKPALKADADVTVVAKDKEYEVLFYRYQKEIEEAKAHIDHLNSRLQQQQIIRDELEAACRKRDQLQERLRKVERENRGLERLSSVLKDKIVKVCNENENLKRALSINKALEQNQNLQLDPYLKKIYGNYPRNETLMSLAELFYYLKSNVMIRGDLAKTIEKSTDITALISICDYNNSLDADKNYCEVEKFADTMEEFLCEYYGLKHTMVTLEKKIPKHLVCNVMALYGIVFRFVGHCLKSIDKEERLKVEVTYKENRLILKLSFKKVKHKGDSFGLFRKKDRIYHKNQIIYKMNEKILLALQGTMRVDEDPESCSATLTLPAKIANA